MIPIKILVEGIFILAILVYVPQCGLLNIQRSFL